MLFIEKHQNLLKQKTFDVDPIIQDEDGQSWIRPENQKKKSKTIYIVRNGIPRTITKKGKKVVNNQKGFLDKGNDSFYQAIIPGDLKDFLGLLR